MKISSRNVYVVAAVIAASCASAYLIGWLEIDRCLDAGGRWNYDLGACEKNDGATYQYVERQLPGSLIGSSGSTAPGRFRKMKV